MIFSTKQLRLLILCTFPGFGEMSFGETGLNQRENSSGSRSGNLCRGAGSGWEAYYIIIITTEW